MPEAVTEAARRYVGTARILRKGDRVPLGATITTDAARALADAWAGQYLSLFCWSVSNDQISKGVSAGDFTVLIVVGLCASVD